MTRTSRFPRWLGGVRLRVTLAATAVSLLGVGAGAGLFVDRLHENLEQALLSSAQQQADTVQAQLEADGSPQQAVVSGKKDLIIQIVDARGRVLASDHPTVATALRDTPGVTETARVPDLEDGYAVYAQTASTGDLIVVGLSEEQSARATSTALLLLAIGVPIVVLLIAVVVWLAIGRALRPVEAMRSEAATITTEHLHRRLPVPPGDDEIPHLATTLNAMLDRIDASQRLQRQFISDASHELRSPLATVRQMLEVAHRHPDATTVQELVDDVWFEEARMEALVKALLTLARLDDRELAPSLVVDLDDAVIAEVDRLRAKGTGLVIDISRVSGGQIYGDPVLLNQVVANLLTNAARHARSTVRIELDEVGGRTVLVVDDDGSGIAVEDRDRVFERFARLDEARARDAGGAGLGLAIVKKVVDALGGTVAISDSTAGGARFTVVLPTPGASGV